MEEVPQMPSMPAAGQAVTGEDVFAAEQAASKRAFLSDNASPEGKAQRGDDSVRVFNITAAAAEFQVQQQGQQELQQMLQRLEQRFDTIDARFDTIDARFDTIDARFNTIDARLYNTRLRAINQNALGCGTALQPLRRELQQAAADGAAAGDLPPAGVFPANRRALNLLTNAQLDALQEFYGELFAGNTVAARREALADFVSK